MVMLFFMLKTAYEMRMSDWSSDVCSSDLLRKYHARAAYRLDRADDQQIGVELRGAAVFYGEIGDRPRAFTGLHRCPLIDARDPQHVRPRAFHIAQVIGVVDDARQVGVLEIDARPEMMLGPDEGAGDKGGRGAYHCPDR